MRPTLCWLVLPAMLLVRPLGAQNPDQPERAERLRQQVEGRFAERVKDRLQLSDDQMSRLRGTARTYSARRRELADREREIRSALADQLRPGVAANQDSVSRLTDALVAIRDSHVQTLSAENREMAEYLTPVQRSQLFMMRERLVRRAREIREERRGEERRGEMTDERRGPGRERPRPRRAPPRGNVP